MLPRNPMHRRNFLQAAGVTLALPALEAFAPAQARASAPVERRRLVAVSIELGLHGPFFFPAQAGRDYALPNYLKVIEPFQQDFTVFSGLSHPDVDGGHSAESSFLTAVPHPGHPSFRNGVSLDQAAAEKFSGQTRYDSLVVSSGGYSLSWTRNGVRLPAASKPSAVFAQLFLKGSEKEVAAQTARLRRGRSVMDAVQGQLKQLDGGLGARDREKLDEYLTAVRECEQQLHNSQAWALKPKPTVAMAPPQDIADASDVIGRVRLMYNLIHLAFETDSTRFATFHITATGGTPPGLAGVDTGYHALSHHGVEPHRIEQLQVIEKELMKAFGEFVSKLKGSREDGTTLLDRTMVLLGSSLGNASSHDNRNLPVLLAGGGFRHGQHLAFDAKRNHPLCNLYVSMLQRLGIGTDKFGSSTGTMTGLEVKG